MVGIVFTAVFIGSLSAVTLVFSGWPLWVAIAVYIACGVLGLVLMAAVEAFRPSITNGLRLVTSRKSRVNVLQKHRQTYTQPRPIPALSESYSIGQTKKCILGERAVTLSNRS